MSKGTHAVVAAFAALLIMGSMRSFGNPVRGIGDDAILGMFSLAVVAVFIFIGWLALSSLKGGSSSGGGGGGVSSADFAGLKKSVDDGFSNMQTRIDSVKVDTVATRSAVDEVRKVVDRMEGMLKKWAPYLDDLNATINALLDPIGKGVEEIKKATKALNDWKDTTWKKFSDDITKSVSDVFNKVKTVDVDLAALKGAVGKLDTDQQQIKIVVDEIKKEQGALQKSVSDGFAAVPANVRTEVQKGLDAMQAVLGGKIDTVAANQAAMQGMLSGFVTSFSAWQGSLATTLGGLSGSVAAAVKAEVDNIRTDMTRELSAIAKTQTSVQEALVRLTEAQDKMRKRVKKALAALPTDLQQVMEVQLQRVEKVFTDNITDLKNAQSLTTGEVAGLAATTNALKSMVLARLDQNRQSVKDQLNRQLAEIQETIHAEIEPITSEMFEIDRSMKVVLVQLSEQGDALSKLSKAERERYNHLAETMLDTYTLLEQIGQEGAKADALERLHGGVGLIAQYLAGQGEKLDALVAVLPAMAPLLEQLRALVEKLQERQRKARDRSGEVVKRQKRFATIAGRDAFDYVAYNGHAHTLFASLELLNADMSGSKSDSEKQTGLKNALPLLEVQRKAFCIGKKSPWEQIKQVKAGYDAEVPPLPLDPNMRYEWDLLISLCEESGKFNAAFKNMQKLSTGDRFNVDKVKQEIDKITKHGAFKKERAARIP